jgi:hypothetical protein
MKISLSYRSRYKLVQHMAPRYQEASRAQKILLLEAFVACTECTRKYAIHLLNHPRELKPRSQCSHFAHYRPEVQQALSLAWKAANHIYATWLVPDLAHAHLILECRSQLLSMSAATADRLLRSL